MSWRARVFGLGVIGVVLIWSVPSAWANRIPNDQFGHAKVITALPFNAALDTTGATASTSDPLTCPYNVTGSGPPDGATVWYAFTPPDHIRVTANTYGSYYDTILSVWTLNAGRLQRVACNDDSNGTESAVAFDAEGGTTYYFMVGSYGGGSGGQMYFRLRQSPEIQLAVDSTGTVTDGVATLHGTLTCTLPAFGGVSVILQQSSVGRDVRGRWGTGIDCVGTQPWEAVIQAKDAFLPGPATAQVFAYGCDPSDYLQCDTASQTDIVILGS
jgi:hypothetical protein